MDYSHLRFEDSKDFASSMSPSGMLVVGLLAEAVARVLP